MIKSYPIVHFEISGKCNGKCPYCSTGNKNQPLGNFVDIDIFDKTLDKINNIFLKTLENMTQDEIKDVLKHKYIIPVEKLK